MRHHPKRLKSKSGFVVHFTIENTPKYPQFSSARWRIIAISAPFSPHSTADFDQNSLRFVNKIFGNGSWKCFSKAKSWFSSWKNFRFCTELWNLDPQLTKLDDSRDTKRPTSWPRSGLTTPVSSAILGFQFHEATLEFQDLSEANPVVQSVIFLEVETKIRILNFWR